jgi:hypothetical protein
MTPCIMSATIAWRPVVSAAGASAVRACTRVRDLMRENSGQPRPSEPLCSDVLADFAGLARIEDAEKHADLSRERRTGRHRFSEPLPVSEEHACKLIPSA